jgi:hypothetical protein
MGELKTIDVAQLRMWLKCQGTTPFVGGQRMPGGIAEFLKFGDEILNAYAIAQGQPELVVDIPEQEPEPVKVNRHLLNDPAWLERQAAAENGQDVTAGSETEPFVPDEVLSGTEFPDEVVDGGTQ